MNILIAGASGFIGRKLVSALQLDNNITVLGRDIKNLNKIFSENINKVTWDNLSNLDANSYNVIINLSGYNISDSRWNDKIKEQIISSRVKTTSNLIDWIITQKAHPRFICANAVGIYGLQKNGDIVELNEDSLINLEKPSDFMSEIGAMWQKALQPGIDYGLSVITTRFGVVLDKDNGMLKKLFPSFYMGLGSIIGDGTQVISWIHIDDLIGSIIFLLKNDYLTGNFNLTSPFPVTQREFARSLAKVMNRPLFLTMPDFAIKILFGEMGECLLLKGQRVIPKKLMDLGYEFKYAKLMDALIYEYH